MDTNEVHASLLLSYFSFLSPTQSQNLLSAYSSATLCIKAGPTEWIEKKFLTKEQFAEVQKEWEAAKHFAETELKELEINCIRVFLRQSGEYPTLLRQLSVAPPIIYVLGNG